MRDVYKISPRYNERQFDKALLEDQPGKQMDRTLLDRKDNYKPSYKSKYHELAIQKTLEAKQEHAQKRDKSMELWNKKITYGKIVKENFMPNKAN